MAPFIYICVCVYLLRESGWMCVSVCMYALVYESVCIIPSLGCACVCVRILKRKHTFMRIKMNQIDDTIQALCVCG